MREILGYHLIEVGKYILTPYQIIIAIIIIAVTIIFLRGLKKIFLYRLAKKHDKKTISTIYILIKYFTWVIAIVTILEIIGVNIDYLIASSAAFLVGMGLGIQQIFNDIISGIFLLFEGNVRVGDVVQMSDDTVATVKEIKLRTSKVLTRDGVIIIVPNSKLLSENVINWTAIDEKTRFYVEVGVAYGSDVDKVTNILLKVADEHPKIAKNPKPFVRFNDFGDSALIFRIYFWTNETFTVRNIKSDLRYSIYKHFENEGIQIPFPQQDVYIKQFPGTNS